MREAITKTADAIRDCMFNEETQKNVTRAKNLFSIKWKIEKNLAALKIDYEYEWNKVFMSEAVQDGKNKESRTALAEMEFQGTKFDKIPEYKYLMAVIVTVEDFNRTILKLLFREKV